MVRSESVKGRPRALVSRQGASMYLPGSALTTEQSEYMSQLVARGYSFREVRTGYPQLSRT